MTVKRSEVRSFRLKKELDEKFQDVHRYYQEEYAEKLKAAGITADRSWSFTDTFERMILEQSLSIEKGPQSID